MNKRSPASSKKKTATLPYKNRSLSPAARVKDLLGRMTLEEKAAQMVCVWQQKRETLVDAEGHFDFSKAKAAFKKGFGLGQVGRPSDAGAPPGEPWKGRTARGMAELTNAIQKFFLEHSRLGIPVIFREECLHGQAARDATSFCQPIGLGATFNPELVEALFTMTAYEARVRGTHQALSAPPQ
ncbi:MAG: glycoside hydrolase family 3 N-terminal domain-containing protein [Limisphaerales bacterium]